MSTRTRDDEDLRTFLLQDVETDAGVRDPHEVARAARSSRQRPRWPSVAAVLVAVVVGSLAVGGALSQQSASQMATATVDGRVYNVSITRGIRIPQAALVPHGPATDYLADIEVVDLSTYALNGVDPIELLLMKPAPNQRTGGAAEGDYVLLVRGDGLKRLCPYVDPTMGQAPQFCQ